MHHNDSKPDDHVRLQIRVPRQLAEQLQAEARELTIPRAALVRQVLMAHVRARLQAEQAAKGGA